MKTVTSMTFFNDAVGTRLSASYSEIDESTGKIISDNNRVDRVITDKTAKQHISALEEMVQEFIDSI